jgi:1-deoxyxylulose-5-phosphate synthase
VLAGQVLEQRFNFFDTANVYSVGASEEVLGRFLRAYPPRSRSDRDQGTCPDGRRAEWPSLSRKEILYELDQSLRRLETDYLDLYQIHRWDYETPIEETLEALHDVVKSGKARYIGASSMYAWQFTKALYLADRHGWTRFVSMQNHYNLLYREEEREMMPLCQAEGIVGATKPNHLTDAVAAPSLLLTPEEIASLEEAYTPHPVLGFS